MADEMHLLVPEAQAAVVRMRAAGERFNQIASGLGTGIMASGNAALTPTGTSGTPSAQVRASYQPSQNEILDSLPALANNARTIADNLEQVVTDQIFVDTRGAEAFNKLLAAREANAARNPGPPPQV